MREGAAVGSSLAADLAEWRADRALASASARKREIASAESEIDLSLGGGDRYVTKADLDTLSRELERRRRGRGAGQRKASAALAWEHSGVAGGEEDGPPGPEYHSLSELPEAPPGSATFIDLGAARSDTRLAAGIARIRGAEGPGHFDGAEALLRGLEGQARSVSRMREALSEGAPSFNASALEAKSIRESAGRLSERVEGIEASEAALASSAEEAWARISGEDRGGQWEAVAVAELEGFREKANRDALDRARRDLQGLRYVQLQIAESLERNQSDIYGR
jgi:hypothetical protein